MPIDAKVPSGGILAGVDGGSVTCLHENHELSRGLRKATTTICGAYAPFLARGERPLERFLALLHSSYSQEW